MQIFPQGLGILKDRLVQKFLAVFLTMNRAQNLDFPAVSCNFLGTQKILETRFSPRILGYSKDGLVHFFGTRTSPQFSWDFEGQTHPKN
jgi:hypothetical protein